MVVDDQHSVGHPHIVTQPISDIRGKTLNASACRVGSVRTAGFDIPIPVHGLREPLGV